MEQDKALTELEKGAKAQVVKLPDNPLYLRKLMAFGVLPGTVVTVLQTTPCLVLDIGNTRLALDREIAAEIIVR